MRRKAAGINQSNGVSSGFTDQATDWSSQSI
jgi:hypothetical protein